MQSAPSRRVPHSHGNQREDVCYDTSDLDIPFRSIRLFPSRLRTNLTSALHLHGGLSCWPWLARTLCVMLQLVLKTLSLPDAAMRWSGSLAQRALSRHRSRFLISCSVFYPSFLPSVVCPQRRQIAHVTFSPSSYVELATRRIAAVATSSKIVVEKSTVPCRTAESMRTILEANSKPGCRFDILSNPEFLAEGTAIADLFSPDRVLIGSLQTQEGKDACTSLAQVYANWVP